MKFKIESTTGKIIASIIAGLAGNLLALLSSLLNPLQPQATFDFSHIATFGTAIAFGPMYGLLAGAIGSLYPYYEFAIAGIYGPWWGLSIIIGKAATGFFCGLLRGKLPPFLAVTLSYIPESLFTLGFLSLMTLALPASAMTPQTMADILLEGWVEVIIFSFIIESVVRRRIMETAVLMLEIFIIMLLVHKQFIESLLVLLLVTLITITLFEVIAPAIRKQYPHKPEEHEEH
jgi:hypothetical protein